MTLRQIATINRPFEKDNRLYISFFVEKWLAQGKTKKLFLNLYEKGRNIPFASFTLEKAPNNTSIAILMNEDREILGAYLTNKESAETIIEEIARNIARPEDAFKLEIEEEEVLEE